MGLRVWNAGVMAYFLEYVVPADDGGEGIAFPVSEQERGYTVPLTETDAEVIRSEELPIRTSILSSSIADAKVEAEEILRHSKAETGFLYDDSSDSDQSGSGELILKYGQSGWEEQ